MKSNRLLKLLLDFLASPILSTALGIISIGVSFVLVNQNLGLLTAILTSFLIAISFAVLLLYFYLREKPTTSFRMLFSKISWQISDDKGQLAIMDKAETVKCNHNNIYTYLNRSYGDATSMEFESSVGKPIHTYFDGGKRYDIFYLNRVYNKDEIFSLSIKKTMKAAFTADEEWAETEILHQMDQLEMSITFPKERQPKRKEDVWLVHRFAGSTETVVLSHSCYSYKEKGSLIVTYRTSNPRLGSTYQIRWRW